MVYSFKDLNKNNSEEYPIMTKLAKRVESPDKNGKKTTLKEQLMELDEGNIGKLIKELKQEDIGKLIKELKTKTQEDNNKDPSNIILQNATTKSGNKQENGSPELLTNKEIEKLTDKNITDLIKQLKTDNDNRILEEKQMAMLKKYIGMACIPLGTLGRIALGNTYGESIAKNLQNIKDPMIDYYNEITDFLAKNQNVMMLGECVAAVGLLAALVLKLSSSHETKKSTELHTNQDNKADIRKTFSK